MVFSRSQAALAAKRPDARYGRRLKLGITGISHEDAYLSVVLSTILPRVSVMLVLLAVNDMTTGIGRAQKAIWGMPTTATVPRTIGAMTPAANFHRIPLEGNIGTSVHVWTPICPKPTAQEHHSSTSSNGEECHFCHSSV